MNSGKSEKTPKIALRHSRIGLRLLLNMLAALVLGVIVYIGVTQLGSWAQNSIIYERLFSEEYKQEMLHDLQNYVTDNGISSSDYMQISVWLSDNIGIGFFYDQRTPDNGDYVIQFADRAVSVVPYVTSNAYDQQITLVAAVLALAAALLIIAPYARRISSDIKHLSGDMALIAGGDLSHEVKLKGKTELAELAQSFDQMRQAIAARMERESEAVRANQELIGALSHDLRTPLTKQSSYLELALSERYRGRRRRACAPAWKGPPRPPANCASASRNCFPISSSSPGKRGRSRSWRMWTVRRCSRGCSANRRSFCACGALVWTARPCRRGCGCACICRG